MTRTKGKHAISALAALTILVCGLPRIELAGGWTWQNTFVVLWSTFAVMVFIAHLHCLLRIDEATERTLKRIKREKYARLERMLGISPRE